MSTTNFDPNDLSKYDSPLEYRVDKAEHALGVAKSELQTATKRVSTLEAERRGLLLSSQLVELAADMRDRKCSARDICKLLGEEVELSEDGKLISRRPGQTLAETVKSFRDANPYLFGPPSTTAAKGNGELLAGRFSVKECFGRGSSGKAAAALMEASPAEYARGKEMAQEAGLI